MGLNRTPELVRDRSYGLAADDECLPLPSVIFLLTHGLTLKVPQERRKRGKDKVPKELCLPNSTFIISLLGLCLQNSVFVGPHLGPCLQDLELSTAKLSFALAV